MVGYEALHPFCSSLPSGIITALVVTEIVVWYRTGDLRAALISARLILLALMIVSVALAFLSGYIGAEYASRTFLVPEHEIATHHLWGKSVAFVVLPTALLGWAAGAARYNRGLFMVSYRVMLLVLLTLLFRTGSLGGDLVFLHGAGVRAPTTTLLPQR
jgi:uncharacterized membrane protein